MASEDQPLLCDVLKGAVHKNPARTEEADPYILMIDYIRKHYLGKGKISDALIIEQCFYLKAIDTPVLNIKDNPHLPYKERTLRALIRHWKWDSETLDHMNQHRKWDFSQNMEFGARIHSFMINTYKAITDNISNDSDAKSFISDTDLTILGRKIFTIYDRRDRSKIDFIKRVMNEYKYLDAISFAVTSDQGKGEQWSVYCGDVRSAITKDKQASNALMRTGKSIASIILWLAQNQIYGKSVFFCFVPDKQIPVSLGDLQRFCQEVRSFFPVVDVSELESKVLLEKAVVTKIMVVLNFSSNRWKDEIEKLTIMYTSSWGESFCYALDATAGFAKLLEIIDQTSDDFYWRDAKRFALFVPAGSNKARLTREDGNIPGRKLQNIDCQQKLWNIKYSQYGNSLSHHTCVEGRKHRAIDL